MTDRRRYSEDRPSRPSISESLASFRTTLLNGPLFEVVAETPPDLVPVPLDLSHASITAPLPLVTAQRGQAHAHSLSRISRHGAFSTSFSQFSPQHAMNGDAHIEERVAPAETPAELPAELPAASETDVAPATGPDPTPAPRDEEPVVELAQRTERLDLEESDLLQELNAVREEKEYFEEQYNTLLSKLTTMRSTLGERLKSDAEELDRRADEIQTLQQENSTLQSTIQTLSTELISTNDDNARLQREVDSLRSAALDRSSDGERLLRDAQDELERVRSEREDWEHEAMRERTERERLQADVDELWGRVDAVEAEKQVLSAERSSADESARNLQNVLLEFQESKDREIRDVTVRLQDRLETLEQKNALLEERATTAEAQLSQAQNDSALVLNLSKEVKDKTALIGKLRHETVVLHEHLTEAMRRLKKDSPENSVDRRLISNVLISFLVTPRADTKRFEMLQLIASILAWNDEQREKVGLRRSAPAPPTHTRSRRGHSRSGAKWTTGADDEEESAQSENFSQLWIEFLLREAGNDGSDSPRSETHRKLSVSSQGSAGLSPLSPLNTNTSGPSNTHFEHGSPTLPPLPPLDDSKNRRPSLNSLLIKEEDEEKIV